MVFFELPNISAFSGGVTSNQFKDFRGTRLIFNYFLGLKYLLLQTEEFSAIFKDPGNPMFAKETPPHGIPEKSTAQIPR